MNLIHIAFGIKAFKHPWNNISSAMFTLLGIVNATDGC